MSSNHSQKIALITGASRGIGKAIAQTFAQNGYYVYATATTQTGAQSIAAYLLDAGQGICLDVSQTQACSDLMDVIIAKHGQLDVLINNAGITKDTLAMRMKSDQWQQVLDVNLSAVFYLSQLAIKPMIKARSGCIINITSVVGATGNAGQANYAASKAGVVGMSKSLALELASRNIRVNCIAPGFIETDMTDAIPENIKQELLKKIPMARLGQAKHIADSALFLASEGASYITGQTLHVNGGMHMSS